jgi:transcriptional regulator with XRE-family HTH domain
MSPALLRLPELLARVRNVTPQRGDRAELARFLEVSPQAISNYVNGRSQPSAEVTLRMLDWVTEREVQIKKDAGRGATLPARKAQARKSRSNEKPNSGQAET